MKPRLSFPLCCGGAPFAPWETHEVLSNGAHLIMGAAALPLVPSEFRFQPLPSHVPFSMAGIGETVTYSLLGEPPALARGLRACTHQEGWWAVVVVPETAGESALSIGCKEALAILSNRLAEASGKGAQ